MNGMELSVSLNCIGTELTGDLLCLAADSAIRAFEMPAGFFPPENREEALDLVKRYLPGRTASVHAVFGAAYDISSPDQTVRRRGLDEVLDAVSLARELGAGLVVVHLSAEPIPPEERAVRLKQVEGGMEEIVRNAAANNVRVAVEMLPRTCLGNTVPELLQVVGAYEPRDVGVCLDVNHAMDRYQHLPDMVRALGPYLIHLHLSDYDGVDEKHWMPGEGVIDWKALMEALHEVGYSGLLHYESTSRAENPAGKIRDFEQNYAWLRSFLPPSSS